MREAKISKGLALIYILFPQACTGLVFPNIRLALAKPFRARYGKNTLNHRHCSGKQLTGVIPYMAYSLALVMSVK